MERIHYRISLDMFDTVSQKVLKVKKGDTACDINITLVENGKVYQIADGCYATFSAKKPDGNFILNSESCYIKDNTIVYDVTKQTTICEGVVDCEVILYGADGNQLTSPRFSLLVGSTVYNGEEIVSTTEVDYFGDLAREAILPQEIPQYMLPMGMTIGDEHGRPKNVLVNSGISVEKLNPTMKLIASGTTTAEAPIIAISDTTGGEVLNDIGLPAARPFNLSKFICVKVKVPKASAKTRIWVKLNSVNVGYCINATSTTDAYTYTRFDIYYTGSGNWNYMAWGAGNGQSIGTPWTVPWYTGQGEFVSTINLSLSDNVLFPVGTTYEIYGIEV